MHVLTIERLNLPGLCSILQLALPNPKGEQQQAQAAVLLPRQLFLRLMPVHCLQKKEPVHVGTVAGQYGDSSALGQLLYHLAELQGEDHIQVKAKVVPGSPHPEAVKAAGYTKARQAKPSPEAGMHAVVDIFLLEKGVLCDGQDVSQMTKKKQGRGKTIGGEGRVSDTWQANSRHIAPVLNWLLLTEGIQIGPDCDGLLNFCDTTTSLSTSETPRQAESAPMAGDSEGASSGLPATASAAGEPGGVTPSPGPSSAPVTVQQMLDSVALPDDAPTAMAPSALQTVPKQFQLQGLHWMLARERQGDALGRSGLNSLTCPHSVSPSFKVLSVVTTVSLGATSCY